MEGLDPIVITLGIFSNSSYNSVIVPFFSTVNRKVLKFCNYFFSQKKTVKVFLVISKNNQLTGVMSI